MTRTLNDERMDTVLRIVRAAGVRTLLDLGCGHGDFLVRVARDPAFTRIVGVDRSQAALAQARCRPALATLLADGRMTLHHGSFTVADERLAGFDAAVLIETIEHVAPDRLGDVERAVFGSYRPWLVMVTTPNQEYNRLYEMGRRRFRNPDHRFEWPRSTFRSWAEGVARRCGYDVEVSGIGTAHPHFGCATQMATFRRAVRS